MFADVAELAWTLVVIPRVVILRPEIDTSLETLSTLAPIRLTQWRSPLRVAHRALFGAFTAAQFPHKLGPGVWVNALPGRPHIDSVHINVALRLHVACMQSTKHYYCYVLTEAIAHYLIIATVAAAVIIIIITSPLSARWPHRTQTLPPLAWDWRLIRQQPESQRSTLISRPPTSSSPLRWRTWGLSMLQHWISSVIWARKSLTFPATTERLSSYSSASLWRSHVLTQCFCTTHSASIARTNSHSSYVFNFCF